MLFLRLRHRLLGHPKVSIRTSFNLNEHKLIAVPHHQIDLARGRAKITVEHLETALDQICLRLPLAPGAKPLFEIPAFHSACLSSGRFILPAFTANEKWYLADSPLLCYTLGTQLVISINRSRFTFNRQFYKPGAFWTISPTGVTQNHLGEYMPVGEIIAIGTELLLGETQDTNTSYIARAFRDAGIDLYRTMIVGDNIDRIAQAIREALSRADIVITTGGLGPTVDDPTRLAVARAIGVELEFEPELWEQSQVRFQRFHRHATENNRRQAYIPQGAAAIDNQVGTAPGFYFQEGEKIVISLPGVPREMEFLLQQKVLPLLIDRFALKGIIKSYVLHAAGVGESHG